jgi:large subunit ribosomal protein L21
MYAVVETGGKQYRVQAGDIVEVELLDCEEGQQVTLDRVLAVGEGDALQVGQPTVADAAVEATVLAQTRGPKELIFKHKRRKDYRRLTGHRQELLRLRINSISVGGETLAEYVAGMPEGTDAEVAEAAPEEVADTATDESTDAAAEEDAVTEDQAAE